jgi:hypothetical protein
MFILTSQRIISEMESKQHPVMGALVVVSTELLVKGLDLFFPSSNEKIGRATTSLQFLLHKRNLSIKMSLCVGLLMGLLNGCKCGELSDAEGRVLKLLFTRLSTLDVLSNLYSGVSPLPLALELLALSVCK